MNRTLPTFVSVSLYLTEVTAMCNWYIFFSSTQANGYGYMSLWAWLGLSLLVYAVVHQFLKQERPLPHVVALGGICFFITAIVMSLWFIHVTSWLAWGFAWAALAFSVVRGCVYNLHGCQAQGVLLGCELPLMGLALMLWFQEGGVYHLPDGYALATVAILFVNFMALIIVRMHTHVDSAHGRDWLNGGALATLGICFGGIALLAVGFVHFATGLASTTVSKTSSLIAWIWDTIWGLITAFFLWLVSLFPETEAVPYELEAVDTTQLMEDVAAMEEPNYAALVVAGILVVVAIVGGLLWMLYKFRKLQLGKHRLHIAYKRPQQKVSKRSLWDHFKAFCLARYQAFSFACAIFFKRNTPQGAVLMMAKMAKPRGAGKAPGESYGQYLARLGALCQTHAPDAMPLFAQLSQMLDVALYAPHPPKDTLAVEDYRAMRKAVSKLHRIKVKKSGATP